MVILETVKAVAVARHAVLDGSKPEAEPASALDGDFAVAPSPQVT